MIVDINLLNKYFPWKQIESAGIRYSIKGDIFYKNRLLNIEEIIDVLSSFFINGRFNNQDLVDFLEDFNGNFAIIIDTPLKSICIVDRVRSIPLFYTKCGNHVMISDDCYYIKDNINNKFSEVSAVEFLLTGYVTGSETLIDGINQIQAGEVHIFYKNNDLLETFCYHRYLYKDYFSLSEEELLLRLDSIFIKVFKRLIESTAGKGKQIVIPLSGGLDSRIIAAYLKKLGIENVICFSYGRKNSFEVKISRQVARALGYEWHFIEYTNKKWYECYHSTEMKCYERYSSNLVSSPHKQDFLAIKELKEKGDLPGNSVFIPGHSGDMIAGSHIPVNYNDFQNYNFELFLNDNLKKHYLLWNWDNNEKLKQIFTAKINNCIGDIDICDNESCANAIELFDLKERQSKFIINSVRAYEFMGYEWRIPLWDLELIDFFTRIPVRYKIGQSLYKKYVREKLFVDDFEPLSRIKCTTDFMKENPFSSNKNIFKVLYIFKGFLDYDTRWGRYFKNPLISLFLIKINNCNLDSINSYPLLKFIIDTKNKRKNGVNLNGFDTLYYLLKNIDYPY